MKSSMDQVKARIQKHFEQPYSFNWIHGSNECCFENIAFSIGNIQDPIMEEDVTAFYEFYLQKFNEPDEIMKSDFVHSMVLNGMLYMAKKLDRCDESLILAFQERLDRVSHFVLSGDRIFYTAEERKKIKSVPAVWRNAGIVRQENTSPYLRLPIVYDLLGFSSMYGRNKEIDEKIDSIMAYLFSTQYQNEVESGYGIGINGERGFVKSTYYAVGWDICLLHLAPRQEILYMFLFSTVPSAKRTEWYQSNIQKYQRAVETGDSSFLSQITGTIRKTYWTSGCYLSFGEKKESKDEKAAKFINRLA